MSNAIRVIMVNGHAMFFRGYEILKIDGDTVTFKNGCYANVPNKFISKSGDGYFSFNPFSTTKKVKRVKAGQTTPTIHIESFNGELQIVRSVREIEICMDGNDEFMSNTNIRHDEEAEMTMINVRPTAKKITAPKHISGPVTNSYVDLSSDERPINVGGGVSNAFLVTGNGNSVNHNGSQKTPNPKTQERLKKIMTKEIPVSKMTLKVPLRSKITLCDGVKGKVFLSEECDEMFINRKDCSAEIKYI